MYDIERQKAKVRILFTDNDVSDTEIELQLEMAKDFINDRRRFEPTDDVPMEDKYLNLQVLLTVEALNKVGAEGEKTHTDNGTTRVYENGSPYSTSLVNRIIPLGRSCR